MCIALLISYLGVPTEALGIVMSVDAVTSMLRIPVNVFSATSTSLVVSSRMGVLDRDIFTELNRNMSVRGMFCSGAECIC